MGEESRQAGAVEKICVRCGRDCAGVPRTKDAQGRYFCGACVERLRAARSDGVFIHATPDQAAPDHAPSTHAAPDRAAADDPDAPIEIEGINAGPPEDDNAIPLDADPIGLSEPLFPVPAVCKSCGLLMSAKAVVCTSCGFDTRTNSMHAGPGIGGPKCFNCGYSLVGLKAKRCPECGTATTGRERMLAAERKNARDQSREVYLKPITMFAVGVAISVVMLMLTSGGVMAGLTASAGLMIKYVIYVPFGVIVFLACCLFWIGFNAPVHLTALRLAGVYAVTDAVGIIVLFIPIPIIPWLILGTVYVGLLQDMLELDLIDAVIVGLVTFTTRFVLLLMLAAYLGKWLGG